MPRRGSEKVGEFVGTIMAIGVKRLVCGRRMTEADATALMKEIANEVCDHYGKTYIYVPMNLHVRLNDRDEEIWRDYGASDFSDPPSRPYSAERIAALVRAYHLSHMQIYNIVGYMRRVWAMRAELGQ